MFEDLYVYVIVVIYIEISIIKIRVQKCSFENRNMIEYSQQSFNQ